MPEPRRKKGASKSKPKAASGPNPILFLALGGGALLLVLVCGGVFLAFRNSASSGSAGTSASSNGEKPVSGRLATLLESIPAVPDLNDPRSSRPLGTPAQLQPVAYNEADYSGSQKEDFVKARDAQPAKSLLAVDLRSELLTAPDLVAEGTIVELTGVITEGAAGADFALMAERAFEANYGLPDVIRCDSVVPAKHLTAAGRVVKVRGQLRINNEGGLELKNGLIVEADPEASVSITADQLAEVAAETDGDDAFMSRLAGRDTIVTGKIINSGSKISLKFGPKWSMIIPYPEMAKTLKDGQDITLRISELGMRTIFQQIQDPTQPIHFPDVLPESMSKLPPYKAEAQRALVFNTVRATPIIVESTRPLKDPVPVDASQYPEAQRSKVDAILKSTDVLATDAVTYSADAHGLKTTETNPKYVGKLLEVQGVVGGFGIDTKRPYVVLRSTEKRSKDPTGLRIYSLHPEPWSLVSQSQRLKVRARFVPENNAEEPSLQEGVIMAVEPGDFGPVTLTADELAQELATGLLPTKAKYGQKTLLVTGTLIGSDPNRQSFTIKAQPQNVTVVANTVGLNAQWTALKSNEPVKFACRLTNIPEIPIVNPMIVSGP